MPARLVPFRILCAEQEELLREALVLFLENMGLHVKCVPDGQACVEEVRNNPDAYDYVLVSQELQEMTGLEVARQLRDLAPDLNIGLTTASADPDSTVQLSQDETLPVLPKPYSRGKLRRFLLRHLAGIEPAALLVIQTAELERDVVKKLSEKFEIKRFDKPRDALDTAKHNFANVVVWEVEDPEREWETLHLLQRDAVPTVILDDIPAHKYLYRDVSSVLPSSVTKTELAESIVRAAHGQ